MAAGRSAYGPRRASTIWLKSARIGASSSARLMVAGRWLHDSRVGRSRRVAVRPAPDARRRRDAARTPARLRRSPAAADRAWWHDGRTNPRPRRTGMTAAITLHVLPGRHERDRVVELSFAARRSRLAGARRYVTELLWPITRRATSASAEREGAGELLSSRSTSGAARRRRARRFCCRRIPRRALRPRFPRRWRSPGFPPGRSR